MSVFTMATLPFNLNGHDILQVNSENELVVYFDSSLKPKQCAEAARKVTGLSA